jgi:hypothetical protein
MSGGGRHGRGAPHVVVMHELLVRYLDAWIPAHKKALFVSWAGVAGAEVALRVFAEFADLLVGHPVRMLVPAGVNPADLTVVPGVVVSLVDGPLMVPAKGVAVFGWFDHRSLADVSTVASVVGAEVLAVGPDVVLDMPLSCRVELVAASGEAERLVFGTSVEKSLERFKDELWALDEYAGIRFRDPADEEGGLSDISVVAHLGPLRRTLLRQLTGVDGMTVASLRTWTLRETVFRVGDATRAVQALLAAGSVTRDPPGGRLSTDTVIRAAAAP